jgi:hypothetical protein
LETLLWSLLLLGPGLLSQIRLGQFQLKWQRRRRRRRRRRRSKDPS